MNQEVVKKLKAWRSEIGRKENVELYRILHNKTIEDVATILPENKEEFLSIKGIGEKKFQKYGKDILSIIYDCLGNRVAEDSSSGQEITYTVSDYLDIVNSKLEEVGTCKIRGEVSSVNFKGHLYYSLKDREDESILKCFMWARDYEICGVEIKEGMELTVYGTPEVYKPRGDFSFRTSAVELVGEGALKKAYEELKRKLGEEGLFEEERKKPLPEYPHRIGLITSRDGAVINDFLNNIGRFGYKITFIDSRVEGMMAVKDLINAIKYFHDKPVDVLVIIRGGGSLEALQAFNNEALIREVIKLPMPVLCGIGHDKDVPLLAYVADRAESTPTAVAQALNKSWELAVNRLDYYEDSIINAYNGIIREARHKLENMSVQIKEFYQGIFRKFDICEQDIRNMLYQISRTLKQHREQIIKIPEVLSFSFKKLIINAKRTMDNYEMSLSQNNPERQLKMGYSIITLNGKVVKSVSQVKKGDILISKLGEGKIQSETQDIFNN